MEKQLRAFLIRIPPEVRPHLGMYEPVMRNVLKKIREVLPVVREQQREAGNLVDRLLGQYQPNHRRTGIRRSKKLQTWSVAEELCRRSRDEVFSDTKTAAHFGQLAVEVSINVSNDTPAVGDLRAICFATVGNAYRVMRWFKESSQQFELAYRELSTSGSGDMYAQADVFRLHASLLKDQRLYPEALVVLDQAVVLLRSEGDEHRLARCLVKRGCIHRESGNSHASIQSLMDALQVLDEYRDPWLIFFATQNLASLYCDLGRFTLARSALRSLSDDVIEAALDPTRESNRLQLLWTRARMSAGLGKRSLALRLLAEVEEGFRNLPDPINAALSGLDAARLYHKARKHAEVEDIVKRVHATLQEHDFPHQMRELVAMLVEAAEERRLIQHSLEMASRRLQEFRASRPC